MAANAIRPLSCNGEKRRFFVRPLCQKRHNAIWHDARLFIEALPEAGKRQIAVTDWIIVASR
jgi:hypothetical protein